MNSKLRKILKKFAGPGKSFMRLMTETEYKIFSWMSPDERDRLTRQQIDILCGGGYSPSAQQASALNKGLFADVSAIPEPKQVKLAEQVRSYCRARNYSPEYTVAQLSHRFRFYLTVQWLKSIAGMDHDFSALELGGEDIATDILHASFPQVHW